MLARLNLNSCTHVTAIVELCRDIYVYYVYSIYLRNRIDIFFVYYM